MANLFESYGLEFFEENDETMTGLVGYVASNGKAFSSYYGAPYLYMPVGAPEFWLGSEKDEEGKLHINSFHTHCCGRNIWEMICSDIDLSPKACPKNERILMMSRSTDNGGMLPVDIINADVLPSYLKGDRINLQIVAPCLDVNYYATEEEYDDAQPKDKHGKKWLISDGALMALSFLGNHLVGLYEEGKEYDNDAYVTFRATVKALYHGVFELEGNRENTFIRCIADTQYGELEFHHSIDQVPEEMRKNIKIGSIISGVCILSADAAINEYESGIVKDFDHDLRLLRQTLQKGDAERLRSVLTDDSVYETQTSGKSYHGPTDIINRFQYVADFHDGEYFAHMAEITETEIEDPEFPVGTKCIVLAADEEDNYESIVFMTTDVDGNIARIKVSRDGRYHFEIKHPPRVKTPLDDIEIPESVADPIMARARFHGFLDGETEYEEIAEDPDYSSHASNAQRMLDALSADPQPDAKQAIDRILSYLFAKAVEDTVNRSRENPTMETRLTSSYSPTDAMQGELRTTLEPELHSKLVNDMELAEQFGNDLFSFMEMTDKTDDDFVDTFTQAAVIIQRIGQIYAKHEFISSEGGE